MLLVTFIAFVFAPLEVYINPDFTGEDWLEVTEPMEVREEEPEVVAQEERDVWFELAKCESGNNPTALNPSGKYRGAFQFDLPTFHSTGYTGDPIDYSYEEQLKAAKILHSKRGFQPWPQCAAKLGLL